MNYHQPSLEPSTTELPLAPLAPQDASALQGGTEVQRRAAEWERQIEHLDAKAG